MATSRSCWKARERQVAAYFGSKRTPLSGMNSGHETNSDSLSRIFYIETKLRASNATFKLFQETCDHAKKESKIPVVALCGKFQPGFLVITDSENFPILARAYLKFLTENKNGRTLKICKKGTTNAGT